MSRLRVVEFRPCRQYGSSSETVAYMALALQHALNFNRYLEDEMLGEFKALLTTAGGILEGQEIISSLAKLLEDLPGHQPEKKKRWTQLLSRLRQILADEKKRRGLP